MRTRNKNPVTKGLIASLESKGKMWKAVARGLERPRRISYEVSVRNIGKIAKDGEVLVVPGRVLGSGEVGKAVTVAALSFSGQAREKIEKAGGKALPIQELADSNPEGRGVRILG